MTLRAIGLIFKRLLMMWCFSIAAHSHSGADIVSKETIYWGVGHQPPRVILDAEGELSGQGGIQQKMLEEGLVSDYNSKRIIMNWARIQGEIKNGKNVCASFLMKNAQREQYIEYSLPWHIDLPHRIVMSTQIWELLGKPATLSLKTLSRNKKLRGLIGHGRSYGNLDPILESLGRYSNLSIISTGPINGLNMLAKGRMDYVIELPYHVRYFQQTNELAGNSLKMIVIEEAGPYNLAYVGCPKNRWGKTVIEHVNEVIKDVRARESYKMSLKALYSDEKDKAIIERIYNQDFLAIN